MADILLSQKEVPTDLLEYFEPVALNHAKDAWAINPQAFPGAHYAVWPPALVAPMISASTSEHGVCAACGAPWDRVVEKGKSMWENRKEAGAAMRAGDYEGGRTMTPGDPMNGKALADWKRQHPDMFLGFSPTCTCAAGVVPAVVLDPFAGSATTCTTARAMGRRSVGIDMQFSGEVLRCRDLAQMRLI